MLDSFTNNLLDVMVQTRSAPAALDQIDLLRRVVAGEGIMTIHRNITTASDPLGQVRLQRLYSSHADLWPVQGSKLKTRTHWSETLFLRGEVFIGEGEDVLSRTFDDYELMRPHRLRCIVNVPLMKGNLCYATFNVLNRRSHWQPQEIAGIRLLALAAARWIDPEPDLSYSFESSSVASTAQVPA